MSNVLKKDRHEAYELFLLNARNLEIYTIEQCIKTIPRQYKTYVSNQLVNLSHSVYDYLEQGYSIRKQDRQEMKKHYLTAYGKLHAFVSQIEIAYELIHFEEKILEEWSGMIDTEIRLIEEKL